MLLNDKQIRQLAEKHRMIDPFVEKQKHQGVISYGLSSFGYDIRVAEEFKIFTNVHSKHVDPKNFSPESYIDVKVTGDHCLIPPNSFALARSVEYMRMPEDVFAIAVCKSTYARCGIVTNVTPIEPGWEGYITLEISNTTSLPAKIYANEGLVQLVFLKGEKPDLTYNLKGGKYHKQNGITLPRI